MSDMRIMLIHPAESADAQGRRAGRDGGGFLVGQGMAGRDQGAVGDEAK
jgi:hypothetical protein